MSAIPLPDKAFRARLKEEIPEGAVIMTQGEIHGYINRKIESWEPKYEMWAFRFGNGILAGITILSAAAINAHFRNKFFLGQRAILTTYLPTVIMPAFATVVGHQLGVQDNILTGQAQCPVCVETRAGFLQVLFGVLYPLTISPIISIISARKYQTCSVPNIREGAEVVNYIRKISPRHSLFLFVVLNFGAGMFMSGQQMLTLTKVLQQDVRQEDFKSEGFE